METPANSIFLLKKKKAKKYFWNLYFVNTVMEAQLDVDVKTRDVPNDAKLSDVQNIAQ